MRYNISLRRKAAALLFALVLTACGDGFLDTDIYDGVDSDIALDTTPNVVAALNGAYYRLCEYSFAGNYATMTGDIASDIAYWNGATAHQSDIYGFYYTDTSASLKAIWQYGYKVADHSARVIRACEALAPTATEADRITLARCKAEAHTLRAYAHFVLVNIFGHQVMVAGRDCSGQPGIPVIDHPVDDVKAAVTRATVGQTYAAITADLADALAGWDQAGGDRGDLYYFGRASATGLLARVNLYLERYTEAADCATKALTLGGNPALAYSPATYKALYNGGKSNTESFMALAINASTNWGSNSCGTLWSSYDYSPSPRLLSLYGPDDARRSIMAFGPTSSALKPVYAAGKFACYSTGIPAQGTNYLINAPEMHLILAECAIHANDLPAAAAHLLVVARRNPAITSTADLPADAAGLRAFLLDERARELFQEGHRLYDLRRLGIAADLTAIGAPQIEYSYTHFNVADIVFPIPSAEINTHRGVTQTPGWKDALPTP